MTSQFKFDLGEKVEVINQPLGSQWRFGVVTARKEHLSGTVLYWVDSSFGANGDPNGTWLDSLSLRHPKEKENED